MQAVKRSHWIKEHSRYLIVLQQDEAEVELTEGQFQVSDVPMLNTFLMGQVEDWLFTLPQCGKTAVFFLRIQS